MPSRLTPLLLTLHAIEGLFGAVFAFGIGVLFSLFVLVVIVVLGIVCLVAEWRFLLVLKATLGEFPLAIRVAMKLKIFNLFLRPAVATWFLAHVGVAVILSVSLQQKIISAGMPVYVRVITSGVAAFIGSFTANLYLLMAFRGLGASEGMVRTVWRKRLLIDLSIAVGVLFVPLERWFS